MQLKKAHKILLLLGAVLPMLYIIFFIFTVVISMFLTIQSKGEPWIFKHFGYLFLMHGLVMLMMLGTLIFYLIYIFKSDMDQQMKLLWALVIFIGGPIGMLTFWFVKIRRDPSPN